MKACSMYVACDTLLVVYE